MNCEKCNTVIDKNKLSKWASGRFCSRTCANSRQFSEESRRKKSIANKVLIPWNKGTIKIETRNCSVCSKEFTVASYNKRKTCSDYCKRKAPGQGGYRPNSTRKIRSEYNGYWMDSGAERKFAELLDANDIKWIKNTDKFFTYRDGSGKSRKYYPDFYLPEYDYWVEIKGLLYMNDNDPIKLASVGNNIELQMHNEIRLPKCIK
jgi:uncharacterized CHY-type Zn-finger protein